VSAIWLILVEFLFRLTFGVAVAMAVTPGRLVTSGFFRIHLWVLMGVNTFAALAVYSSRDVGRYAGTNSWMVPLVLAIAAAVLSYVGAVIWMYERLVAGKIALWMVAACGLAASLWPYVHQPLATLTWAGVDRVSGGLLLGFVVTAMLLGHWYLNTPTMRLEPLQRLILLLAAAIVLRMAVSGLGLGFDVNRQLSSGHAIAGSWWLFVGLRWLSGLVGTAVAAGMTWQTLKIPNTQSATGILYAGVIVAFIGELTAQLLSAESAFPL
jgi:hypothetical protein